MSTYSLPPVKKGTRLEYKHFPTRMQLFVYRNWGVVDADVLAEVLSTTRETVVQIAHDMGLEDCVVSKEWLEKGYITIIRANWHLLPYNQLCKLLGWSEEKLAYILKEDDFLSHKLGAFKSDISEVVYTPLTEEQRQRTKRIKEITLQAKSMLEDPASMPFDFSPVFKRISESVGDGSGDNVFEERIVYSYCALYGDTLTSIDAIDSSFPDELLEAYMKIGINGVWMQAVMYMLVPFPFDFNLSSGYEKRLDGLNYLVNKLKKYNIKLYLYLNEPRSMPEEFFVKYPELKGEEELGFFAMCTSAPEVKEYIRNGCAFLARKAPGLGGFITITASENLTNCYSRTAPDRIKCERCKKRSFAEVIAEVNRLIYEGVSSVSSDMKVIAWSWAWKDQTENIVKLLPPGITVMGVSEEGVTKNIGGVETSVIDYSISVVGPGSHAISTWRKAKEKNMRAMAKIQANCTWECASVPFIPAFDLVYKHVKGIIETNLVDGIMMGWTLGGYPSFTLIMLKYMFEAKNMPTLDELYEMIFSPKIIPQIRKASKLFSEAFNEFPFSLETVYHAPQNFGPGNLLFEEKANFKATMIGFPYDDIDSWRHTFPADVFVYQLKKLSETWRMGIMELENVDRENPIVADVVDCAKALYCHFRSTYLQALFVVKRDRGEDVLSILEEEKSLCLELVNIMAGNPMIGYESSNHYFYTRASLLEKYVCCEYLIERFKGRDGDETEYYV